MRIATWNIERLKHKKDLDLIVEACDGLQADILVLTESDERVRPEFKFCAHTPTPPPMQLPPYPAPLCYASTEHRVSIFSNYPCVQQHPTFDEHTALCVELDMGAGRLLVYGTIIGVLGNRHPSFQRDLEAQLADLRRLLSLGHGLCICGDFNCSFADDYYFTKAGRTAIQRTLDECGLRLLTGGQPECIDHIAISESLAGGSVVIEEWNTRKNLSDHKGIAVDFGDAG